MSGEESCGDVPINEFVNKVVAILNKSPNELLPTRKEMRDLVREHFVEADTASFGPAEHAQRVADAFARAAEIHKENELKLREEAEERLKPKVVGTCVGVREEVPCGGDLVLTPTRVMSEPWNLRYGGENPQHLTYSCVCKGCGLMY